jgi:hypothetical protein
MRHRFLLAALTLCCSAAIHAAPEPAPPACPATPRPVPAAYDGWGGNVAIEAARGVEGLAGAPLTPGQGADVRLHPDGQVTYITLPKGAGEAASYGGLARVTIARAGTYRVALGGFVWVDLVRDGKPAATVKFGHGPECTPIRKIVDFELRPGTYTLEVSGSKEPSVRLMILPAPPQS